MAVPAQFADIFIRPRLRVHIATLWPLPTSPSRFSTGMATSSSCIAQTDDPCRPSSFSWSPMVSPGLSRSRRNAEKAVPSTLAKMSFIANVFDLCQPALPAVAWQRANGDLARRPAKRGRRAPRRPEVAQVFPPGSLVSPPGMVGTPRLQAKRSSSMSPEGTSLPRLKSGVEHKAGAYQSTSSRRARAIPRLEAGGCFNGPCHKYGRSYDTHHAVADGWDSGVVVSVGWASDGERHEVLALLGESQTTVAVTARIGDGSMGEVHRARDTKLDRGVAAGEPRPGPALDTPSASAIIGTVSGAASQTGGSRGAGAPPRPCPRRS